MKLGNKRKKTLNSEDKLMKVREFFQNDLIERHDIICRYCEKKSLKNHHNVCSQSSTSTDSSSNDPSYVKKSSTATLKQEEVLVEMPFMRVVSTHNYCFVCPPAKRNNLVTVPWDARLQAFKEKKIFIPPKNVCCRNHLIKNRFYVNELELFRIVSSTSNVSLLELNKMLDTMVEQVNRNLMGELGDFNFPEKRLKALTGFSWEQVLEIQSMLTSMRSLNVRSVIQGILVFLFKIRSGNSNEVIASILGMEYSQQISNIFDSVLDSFDKDVISTKFGLKNLTRADLLNENSNIATKIHGTDKLILICDGTYIRHQKSTNNEYQRKSYSGQKKVPLCKPFTICTSNGFIVDMLGPYLANKNDASILLEILKDSSYPLKLFFQKEDILIVDRGFRDAISVLNDLGIHVLMPALKGKRS